MVGVPGLEPGASCYNAIHYSVKYCNRRILIATTTVTPQRIVGYARVSTEGQAGPQHGSLETQQDRILEFVSATGGTHVATFVDVQSGRRDDRPEYRRMLQLIEDGGADVVVLQWLDRFGRNPREILRRIWDLQDRGVTVETTDEDIREEMLLLIRAGMAGAESKKTSERVKSTMIRSVSKGSHSGRVPFGFKPVRVIVDGKAKVDHWEIEEGQARTIREMVRLAVEENLGYKSIADRLNDMGFYGRSGPWSSASIRVVLRNPSLKGVMAYGRRPVVKTAEPPDVLMVEGVFPPILTDEEWNALQQRLDIRQKLNRGGTHKSDYLLSGILMCGHCGGPMVGKVGASYKGRPRYRNYYCGRAFRSKALCSFYNGHGTAKLEEAVMEYLGQFSDPDVVRQALNMSEAEEAETGEKELARFRKRLSELEDLAVKDLERLDRGVYSDDDYKMASARRAQEAVELRAQENELSVQVERKRSSAEQVDKLPTEIRAFIGDFGNLDVKRQKAWLQTILGTATVWNDGRIELEFRA